MAIGGKVRATRYVKRIHDVVVRYDIKMTFVLHAAVEHAETHLIE